MSNALTQDITDAINKNLSAQVATVLKARLESVDLLEADAKVAECAIRDMRAQLATRDIALTDARGKLVVFLQRETVFAASEKAVAAAQLDTAVSTARLEGAMEVTRLVFANNIIRRTLQAGGSMPVASSGGYASSQPTSKNETETIEG